MIRFTNPEEKRRQTLQKRLVLFHLFLATGFFVILIRSVSLMLTDNESLRMMAVRQYRVAVQKETIRGRILDRKGGELAISVPAWSLYADPRYLKDAKLAAASLSRILGLPPGALYRRLHAKSRFVWIKRKIDSNTMEKVNELQLEGIYSLKENIRFYPHGELAGNILGAVGVDSQALGGIEMAYDSYLMMEPETGLFLKDARGKSYLAADSDSFSDPVRDKGDVYLTLDKGIQFFAEAALKKAVQKARAKGGVAMVMDPATGDILAMANEPSLNPNQFRKASFKNWRNRAVTDLYEPGSTFKVIFAAALLESNVVKEDDVFDCEEGSLVLPSGHVISDHSPYGKLTMAQVIKVSSNIGAYKMARLLTREGMYRWVREFGFGSKLGLDFPGEAKGIVRPYEEWGMTDEATIAFGQGIGVTPLQMLSAFGLIANGGIQMRPHLVEKVVGSDGTLLYQASHEVLSQPIRAETAKRLTQILRGVVGEGGTAPLADIPEYPVAGKTGTAQKPNPSTRGYLPQKYVASFIGFAPKEDPKLAILVLIDEPEGVYYGGQIAAPVFREIMLASLQHLGEPPHNRQGAVLAKKDVLSEGEQEKKELEPEGKFFKVPNFQGASLREVLKTVTPYPLEVELKGRGVAFAQDPKPGTHVLAGSKIYVEFQPLY